MKQTIALFGGSFDPVQNAHKDIIDKLASRFDKVIIMPTAVSPFKTNRVCESGQHRVQMLKRCTRGMENVKVSRFELKKEGISYTVDTIKHLMEKYPDFEVYTVIGSEEVPFLNKWHNCDELKELTVFYVVQRPQFPVEAKVIESMMSDGWRIKTAPFIGMDVSSSEVKLERAFYSDNLPVPKSVAKYIEKNDLYKDFRFITDRYEEFGLKKERIEHSKRTAYAAIALAKQVGVSSDDALTAALLHDIAKETDAKWLTDNGYEVPPQTYEMPQSVRHAFYGAVIANKCFGIEDSDILDAIRLHACGDVKMSDLAQVVFVADYIEEGRDCKGAEITRLHAREGLKKAVEIALRESLDYLKQRSAEIYPVSVKAYNYFKKLNKQVADSIEGKVKEKTPTKRTAKAAAKSEQLDEAVKTAGVPAKKSKKEKVAAVDKIDNETAAAEKNAAAQNVTDEKMLDENSGDKNKSDEKPVDAKPQKSRAKQETGSEHEQAHDLAYTIGEFLNEKKAMDIELIDISQQTIIADYFVVASATSTTQVRALAEYVDEKLSKNYKIEPARREIDSKWYVVDYGSVIVHIFYDELRKFYQLERLWADGTNVERIGG